ncbi:MAG: hypothetical protein PHT23_01385 [Bacteroidales bacterium]|nr:hypothetical protein [Bacteroidales bacterium]
MTEVFINGLLVDIVSDISIRRSCSSLVSSASFSTPLNLLSAAQDQSSVLIRRDGTRFRGNIQSYSLQYQGRAVSISLQCADDSLKLATSGRVSFASGTMAGDAIESLLDGTGISPSGVALRSTALPEDCYVFPVNSNRIEAVKKIATDCGAVFYLQFTETGTIAVCDTWTNLLSTSDFTTTVSVSDSSHLVMSFSLDSAPENPTEDKASIVMAGTPAYLYNLLNLSGLYTDMKISYPVSTWRISEVTTKIQASGVITTATLVNSTLDISSSSTTAGTQDTTEVVREETVSLVDKSLARIATVTDTDTGTVTVEYYSTEEEETITDWAA